MSDSHLVPIASGGSSKIRGPRACTTCAKAKSRCHPGPDASICERCHRLNKPCSSQIPAQPRKRKDTRPNRVAELERRLQDLTNRLQPVVEAQQHQKQQQQEQRDDQQQPSPPVSNPATPEGPRSVPKEIARLGARNLQHLLPGITATDMSDAELERQSSTAHPSPNVEQHPSSNSNDSVRPTLPSAHGGPLAVLSSCPWPDPAEAALLLNEYHQHMTVLFPFVVVPTSLSSDELRRQRPMLWKAVMILTCHMDGHRQVAMGNQLVAEIAVAALTAPSKSLDLLQALQLLLAWFNYGLSSFQITNFLFLARSLCVSLGISEPQAGSAHKPLTSARLEEMRAYAGTYYLVALTLTTNRKPDVMMSTTYLDTCCQVIQDRMEHSTDNVLVYLVKIQQLTQAISLALAPYHRTATKATFSHNDPQADELPLGIVVRTLQQRLAAFRQSIPDNMNNTSLMSHFYAAQILLYEISLAEPAPQPEAAAERLELLWSCLEACRAYMRFRFDHHAVTCSGERPRVMCLGSLDFVFAKLTCLKMWMMQPPPGWDRAMVRRELDLDAVASRMIDELAGVVAGRSQTVASYFSRTTSTSPLSVEARGACPSGLQPSGHETHGAVLPEGLNSVGPPDYFEILRQRLVSIRKALRSEAQDVFRALYTADRLGSSMAVMEDAVGIETPGSSCEDMRQRQQQQDQQHGQQQDRVRPQPEDQHQELPLPPPPHLPMSDVDLDSWTAALFDTEDAWDPTSMTIDWSA